MAVVVKLVETFSQGVNVGVSVDVHFATSTLFAYVTRMNTLSR